MNQGLRQFQITALIIAALVLIGWLLWPSFGRIGADSRARLPAANEPATDRSTPQTGIETTRHKPDRQLDFESRETASDDGQQLGPELSGYFGFIQNKQTDIARIRIHNHLEQHADDGRAMFLFGLSYHKEQRYGLAKPWFQKALASAPEYRLAHYFFGWCLYNLGENEAARREFETYEQSSPREPDVSFALGLLDLDDDQLHSAKSRFLTAIALESADPQPDAKDLAKHHARLAEVYEREDDFATARVELTSAVTLNPDAYEAHYRLSRVLARLKDTEASERAYRDYQKALQRVRPGIPTPAVPPP